MAELRRIQVDGHHWAEHDDGSWWQWDVVTQSWQPSPGGPPRIPPPPPVAATAVRAQLVHDWFESSFPTGGIARVLLVLTILPFTAFSVEVGRRVLDGKDFSASVYGAVLLAALAVAVLWLSGFGTGGHRDAPVVDFLGTGAAGLVAVQATLLLARVDSTITGESLLRSTVVATALALGILVRKTPWSLVVYAAITGTIGAVLLSTFASLWGLDDAYFAGWLLTSLIFAALAFPFWSAARSGESILGSRMWIGAAGTAMALILAGGFFRLTEGDTINSRVRPSLRSMFEELNREPSLTEARSNEEVASGVIYAWMNGDRDMASEVATPEVMELLFSHSPSSRSFPVGCGFYGGRPVCGLDLGDGRMVLLFPEQRADGTFFVSAAQVTTSTTQITY